MFHGSLVLTFSEPSTSLVLYHSGKPLPSVNHRRLWSCTTQETLTFSEPSMSLVLYHSGKPLPSVNHRRLWSCTTHETLTFSEPSTSLVLYHSGKPLPSVNHQRLWSCTTHETLTFSEPSTSLVLYHSGKPLPSVNHRRLWSCTTQGSRRECSGTNLARGSVPCPPSPWCLEVHIPPKINTDKPSNLHLHNNKAEFISMCFCRFGPSLFYCNDESVFSQFSVGFVELGEF